MIPCKDCITFPLCNAHFTRQSNTFNHKHRSAYELCMKCSILRDHLIRHHGNGDEITDPHIMLSSVISFYINENQTETQGMI